MGPLHGVSRRSFVRLGVSSAALAPLAMAGLDVRSSAAASGTGDPWRGLKLGIASYSFSRLPLEAAIDGIKRVGLGYVSIKDAHLPMSSTAEQRKAVVKKFRDAGIVPLSCGVVNMTDDRAMIRNAFEYARDADLPVIVAKPTRAGLPVLDKMVKEFDIKVAIHNHGPEDKVWPSPYDVWEAIQSFDPRIGVCVDVGHTIRCGVDPAESIRKCASRLYDVHLKDLASKEGKSQPIELGRGALDLRGILQALIDVQFSRHVGLEYEKDMKDPLPGVAESVGYIRGVLADRTGR
jgi:inosose dehydratase